MKENEEKMPFRNRKLRELIDSQANGNVSEFAIKVGRSQQSINRLLNVDKRNGKYPTISNDMEADIIKAYGLDEDFFHQVIDGGVTVTDKKPTIDFYDILKMKRTDNSNINIKDVRRHYIPEAMAGVPNEEQDDSYEMKPVVWLFPKYDFTVSVSGDSMYPDYQDGDVVACKDVSKESWQQWGRVFLITTRQGVLLKKLYDEGDHFRCESINHEEYPDYIIPKSEVFTIARVVGCMRIPKK